MLFITITGFLDCDDTSMGDFTSHHENSVTQETSVELPPLALQQQQNALSSTSAAGVGAIASPAPLTSDEIDMDEHPHNHTIIHEEIDCKDLVEHLQENGKDDGSTMIAQSNARDRGLSFDIFACFHDETTNNADVATVSSRKMSFGSTFDLPHASGNSTAGRPRGDSIFFDNCNFNATDSITEENALTTELLDRRRGYSITSLGEIEQHHDKNNDIIVPLEAVSSNHVNNTQIDAHHFNDSHNNTTTNNGIADHIYPSYDNNQQQSHQHHFTSSTDNINVVSSSTSNSNNCILPSVAMCQMELLNKGGRIGIYLPDARKARIAKFHSKRKLRIWRKRIKYDCRKKLADSRPRIKGRFVKRIDVETLPKTTTTVVDTKNISTANTTIAASNQVNINNNPLTSELVVSAELVVSSNM